MNPVPLNPVCNLHGTARDKPVVLMCCDLLVGLRIIAYENSPNPVLFSGVKDGQFTVLQLVEALG